MAASDLAETLLLRVPGVQVALVLEAGTGLALARAAREPGRDLALIAARAARLLEAVLHTGGRGQVTELVLEAGRATLLLLPVPQGTVGLLLDPGTAPAQAAFEARRALGGGA